jgi:hypothetical protein
MQPWVEYRLKEWKLLQLGIQRSEISLPRQTTDICYKNVSTGSGSFGDQKLEAYIARPMVGGSAPLAMVKRRVGFRASLSIMV